jgi:hypothetical protein
MVAFCRLIDIADVTSSRKGSIGINEKVRPYRRGRALRALFRAWVRRFWSAEASFLVWISPEIQGISTRK